MPHQERDFTCSQGHALAMGRVKRCWIDVPHGEAGVRLMSSLGRAKPLPAPRPGLAGLRRGPAVGVQLCKSDARTEGRTCLDKQLSEKRGERSTLSYRERQDSLLLSPLQEETCTLLGERRGCIPEDKLFAQSQAYEKQDRAELSSRDSENASPAAETHLPRN